MAIDSPHAVVQQDVSRARRSRAAIGSDDPVGRQRDLDFFALKPIVQEIRGALRENLNQPDDLGARKAAQLPHQLQIVDKVGDALRREIGRRCQQQRLRHHAQLFKMGFVAWKCLGVMLREFSDLGQSLGTILPHEKVTAVGERGEKGRVLGIDAVTEALQLQIAHHFFLHEAGEVGRGRNAISRPDLFGDGAAAHQLACF